MYTNLIVVHQTCKAATSRICGRDICVDFGDIWSLVLVVFLHHCCWASSLAEFQVNEPVLTHACLNITYCCPRQVKNFF